MPKYKQNDPVPDITFYDEGFNATTIQVQWNTKRGMNFLDLNTAAIGSTVKKSYGYELMEKAAAQDISYHVMTESPLFD